MTLQIFQHRFDRRRIALLHCAFHPQGHLIAPDRGHRQCSAIAAIDGGGIPLFKIPSDFAPIPRSRVPHVRDLDVIVLAPEKWGAPEGADDPEQNQEQALRSGLASDGSGRLKSPRFCPPGIDNYNELTPSSFCRHT